MFATSSAVSGVALLLQFLCSVYLEPSEFVSISTVFFTLNLIAVFASFANDFYVMRTNNSSGIEHIVVNGYSFLIYIVVSTFVLIFTDDSMLLLPLTFVLLMQIFAAKLRLTENIILSSILERYSILLFSLLIVSLTVMSREGLIILSNDDSIKFFLTVFSAVLFCFLIITANIKINLRIRLVLDKSFALQQVQVFLGILIINCFTVADKLVVSEFMTPQQSGYYFILFYIFSVYRLIGQTIYKYFFTFFKNDKTFKYGLNLKHLILMVVLLQVLASICIYYLYKNIFDNKYIVELLDIILIVCGSTLYCVYQLTASKIISRSTQKSLTLINIYSCYALMVALLFVYLALKFKLVLFMLTAFCVFWLGKLIAGHVVMKRSVL